MTEYSEAMEFLNSFSKKGEAVKDLSRFKRLMELLGNPQDSLRFIHIAGTNGKGSVTEYCSSVLIHAGYKVGQFTSPYVICYEDRIRINGVMISTEKVVKYMNLVANVVGEVRTYSQFEITAAVMFLYFADEKCDIVCMETGLGGALDCTNIVKNTLVSVITSVSLDHTAILGDTIEKIAEQKLGIVKPHSKTVVSLDNDAVVFNLAEELCHRVRSKLIFPEINGISGVKYSRRHTEFNYMGAEYVISMMGKFQIANAITAIEALKALDDYIIYEKDIREGLKVAKIPSRLEIIREEPLLILDGAHNPGGTKALADSIDKIYEGRRFTVICGMLTEKDCRYNVENISQFAKFVYTVEDFTDKTEKSSELLQMFNKRGIASAVINIEKIADFLNKTEEDVIICGSLYLTSYVRKMII